jgi:hypothetical protein
LPSGIITAPEHLHPHRRTEIGVRRLAVTDNAAHIEDVQDVALPDQPGDDAAVAAKGLTLAERSHQHIPFFIGHELTIAGFHLVVGLLVVEQLHNHRVALLGHYVRGHQDLPGKLHRCRTG